MVMVSLYFFLADLRLALLDLYTPLGQVASSSSNRHSFALLAAAWP